MWSLIDQNLILACRSFSERRTRSWSLLSKEEVRGILKEGCMNLEITSMEINSRAGWNVLRCIRL
jgi:hypothetical protein